MYKKVAVIYVLKQKIGGKDMYERIAQTRRELMKFGCRELQEEVIESSPTSRQSMLTLLDKFMREVDTDPIIAVSTWEEIRHPDVVQRLIDGAFSLIVADKAKSFEDSMKPDTQRTRMDPVLKHIIDMQASLREYLQGREATKGSKVNLLRKMEAKEFAEKLWPHIAWAVEEAKTTKQSEIAKFLNEAGHRTRTGREITQPLISRYIEQAGKGREWDALLKQYGQF